MYDELELHELAIEYEGRPAQDVIAWAIENFHPRLYIACSGQAEDMVIRDMAYRINPQVRVFTDDTGRLHEETYRLMEKVYEVYGIRIEVYFPDKEEVEDMVRRFGVNLFLQVCGAQTPLLSYKEGEAPFEGVKSGGCLDHRPEKGTMGKQAQPYED